MTPLPRAGCPVCGRSVPVRVTGELREHFGTNRIGLPKNLICAGTGSRVWHELAQPRLDDPRSAAR